METRVYAVDLNTKGGEGALARCFLQHLGGNVKIEACRFRESSDGQDLDQTWYSKYILPLIYALRIRIAITRNPRERFCYINYLPLWNTLLFALIPKACVLGPVTGGSAESVFFDNLSVFERIVRARVFPIFYRMSVWVIERKFPKVLLGTDQLKSYFSIDYDVHYNFCYAVPGDRSHSSDLRPIGTKDIDVLIYLRNHSTKFYEETSRIAERLVDYGYSVRIVGDCATSLPAQSLGYVDKNTMSELMFRSKWTLSLSTNFYSLFFVESILHGCPSMFLDPAGTSMFPQMSVVAPEIGEVVSRLESQPDVQEARRIIMGQTKYFAGYFGRP